MDIKYQTALLFVKDVATSRDFYESLLQQKVEFDFGENVAFQGGLAIHDANHMSQLLADGQTLTADGSSGRSSFELYFECDDLDAIFARLTDYGVTLVHPIKEQPWGQRVFRFYDPDNHIVEIGEPMPVFIGRFLDQGMSVEEVSKRTSVPVEGVRYFQAEIEKKRAAG